VCGDNGCGGLCGSCAQGLLCSDGLCVAECTPSCAGKVCGDDGCGGTCGSCPAGATCNAGQCLTGCTPQCSGKVCGDDGCGGTCGACAAGATCEDGECVTEECTCVGRQCGDDGCGRICGYCGPDKECNPTSQLCVDKTAPTPDTVGGDDTSSPECPSGQVWNPYAGQCVLGGVGGNGNGDSDGCAGGTSSGAPWLLAGLLALLAIRRRRVAR